MESGEIIGFLSCLLSAVCFGTMFVPMKPFEAKDGFFVQWVQCCACFMVGLVVYIWKGFPKIYPLIILSGVLFGTGNVAAIPIVNEVGMGLALLLWGSTEIIVGWATGRFGWFGVKPQEPASNVLQIVGMVLTLASGFMFAFVKYSDTSPKVKAIMAVATITPIPDESVEVAIEPATPLTAKQNWRSWLRKYSGNIAAIAMSIFAGAFFGEMLTPYTYLTDHYPDEPEDGLVYVFSMGIGIIASSTVYFCLYCACKRNAPYINPQTVLPATAYGILFMVAMAAWFVSTSKLSQAISYPITTRLPGVIGAFWDVFFFKTIRGRRNLLILTGAVIVASVGVVLVGMSQSITL